MKDIPNDLSDISYEVQLKVIKAYGFTVGARDPRFNTKYPGQFMVVEGTVAEIEADHEVPFADGSNGPWCVVGDDLPKLVFEAFSLATDFSHFNAVLEDVVDGGEGILHTNGKGAGPKL